jgi:hypothetical protein
LSKQVGVTKSEEAKGPKGKTDTKSYLFYFTPFTVLAAGYARCLTVRIG